VGILCAMFEVFIHVLMGVSAAYTHVFYVLLALAAFWYGRVSIALAGSLGIIHIAISDLLGEALLPPVVRAVMLVTVTTLVVLLCEDRERYQQELISSKQMVEKKHATLVAYITECAMRLKGPVGIIRDNLVNLRSRMEAGDIDRDEA